MYGVPKVLSISEILKSVSEWDLWSYYIPGVKLGGSFNSPLRKDDNPSASLFVGRTGTILLKDFKLGTFNIWQFLQQKYGLTFVETLQVVDHDFNLGLSTKNSLEKAATMEYFGIANNRKVEVAQSAKLPIKKRKWKLIDKHYWAGFGLSLEFIQECDIIPLQNYWVNDELVYWFSIYDPAYSIEFGRGKRKIYRPLAEKFKWITNAGHDVVQGDKLLARTAEVLIITKSYKDVLLLRTLGYEAVAPQSETVFIPSKKYEDYEKRFQLKYILWDNDETGRLFSDKFATLHGLTPIFVPEESKEKDISDFRKAYGHEETVALMQELIWIK
jgi:hypothetical protein